MKDFNVMTTVECLQLCVPTQDNKNLALRNLTNSKWESG